MKWIYKNIVTFLVLIIVLSGCVTGNDDNAVLRDLNDAFAKTPRITDLLVNGQELTRDTQSNWEVIMVAPGDEVTITATLNTGNGAQSSTYYITRQYYATSTTYEEATLVESEPEETDAAALDPSGGASMDLTTGTMAYSFVYTVPAADDDGDDFLSGDHINVTFWSVNNLGGVGFADFNLEFE